MDTSKPLEAICIRAFCDNNREELKTAIRHLVDEAYAKEITPSFIDFYLTVNNELEVSLYGY